MSLVLLIVLLASAEPGEAKEQPLDAGQLLVRGAGHLEREEFQQALNAYSEVLKREPRDAQANMGRARALIGLGDGQKALGPARLAAELLSPDPGAWSTLGDAYSHESVMDYPRAAEAYRRALGEAPAHREAGLRLARALSFMKEVEQAVAVLQEVLRHHPEDVETLAKLAESFFVIRKLDRAEELIAKALDLAPGHSEALRVREQIRSRRAYNFWIPVIALAALPLLFLVVRCMRKGRVPRVPDAGA